MSSPLVRGAVALLAVALGVLAATGIITARNRQAHARAYDMRLEVPRDCKAARALIATSEEVLRRSPLTASRVRELALARDVLVPGSGVPALLRATALGWRDTPTELLAVQYATTVGDNAAAIHHLDALGRRAWRPAEAVAELRMRARAPGGAKLIAQSLLADPGWRRRYLEQLDALGADDLAVHAQVVGHYIRGGGDRLAWLPLVAALIEHHDYAQADTLWRGSGLGRVDWSGAISDPQLRASVASVGRIGFRWERWEGAITFAPTTTGGMLISAPTGTSGPALTKLVRLAPGTRRLRVTTGDTGAGEKAFGWRLTCLPGGTPVALAPVVKSPTVTRYDAVIPARDCPAQALVLTVLSPMGSGPYEVEIARVEAD